LSLLIGAGLYYLAEIAEEKPALAKRFLTLLIYTVAALHVGLLVVDRLPFFRVALSMASLTMYYLILPDFPMVEYTSPFFIGGIVLSLTNHFVWFMYFLSSGVYGESEFPIWKAISFFALMIWAAPLGFLVSLVSPSEFLPTTSSSVRINQPKRQNAIKSFLSYFDFLGLISQSPRRPSTVIRHHSKQYF
jgi:hypothetical protein